MRGLSAKKVDMCTAPKVAALMESPSSPVLVRAVECLRRRSCSCPIGWQRAQSGRCGDDVRWWWHCYSVRHAKRYTRKEGVTRDGEGEEYTVAHRKSVHCPPPLCRLLLEYATLHPLGQLMSNCRFGRNHWLQRARARGTSRPKSPDASNGSGGFSPRASNPPPCPNVLGQ